MVAMGSGGAGGSVTAGGATWLLTDQKTHRQEGHGEEESEA